MPLKIIHNRVLKYNRLKNGPKSVKIFYMFKLILAIIAIIIHFICLKIENQTYFETVVAYSCDMKEKNVKYFYIL